LILGDHIPVELSGRVGQVVIEFPVFFLLGTAVAVRDEDAGFFDESSPRFGDLRLDAVDVIADIDAVHHSFFVRVLLHEVAVEEANRLCRGSGSQADEEAVEVFEHLPPDVINRTVALVDDDEVERLDRDFRVVDDRKRFLEQGRFRLEEGAFLILFEELLLPFKHRVEALDRRDAHL